MAKLIDGKALAAKMQNELVEKVEKLKAEVEELKSENSELKSKLS